MRCSSCGQDNAEDRRFCDGCGASLPSVCVACGARNEPGARFCEACDEPLDLTESGSSAAGDETTPSPPQSFLRGRYRVLSLLGESETKIVYLAHDLQIRRDVAFALIKLKGLDDAARAGRAGIMREARAMARLGDHPHVLDIYDIGLIRGQPYIVSQYMAGGSLAGRLKRSENHRLPLLEAARIAEEVCQALEHAHSRGVLHRDLKPANILLTEEGASKLADAGFGLFLATELSRLMGVSMTVGTVDYTAPEQALAKPLDSRADLYSLGAILYEMVTGRPPFLGNNLAAVVRQHVNLPPAPPSWRVAGVPRNLELLILKLLAKSPEERPESAAVARAELRAITATLLAPVTAVAAPVAEPAVARELVREYRLPVRVFPRLAQAVRIAGRLSEAVARHPVAAAVGLVALLASGSLWVRHEHVLESRRIALNDLRAKEIDSFRTEQRERLERERREREQIALRMRQEAQGLEQQKREQAARRSKGGGPSLIELAEAGDVQAQSRLGSMYLRGRGVTRDYDEALKWYHKAAQQGDTDAQVGLGYMYAKGEGVPQDYAEALQWFYQAAAQGNRDAQYDLAKLYLLGEGVAQDYAVALEWLRKAAAQGNRDAQYDLARLYLLGQGVAQDYAVAAQWLREASGQGYAAAQNALGYLYEQGLGVTQDYDQALKWYRKAADQGDAKAQLNLGLMYEDGEGIAQDYPEAVRWYRRAAIQGDPVAQTNLAFMFAKGRGVTQDYAEALDWFRKAAAHGSPQAQYALGAMYDDGRGVPKDYAEAVRWYRKAAAQGNRDAQYNLGYKYEHGQGVNQDYSEAVQWYRKAAAQGDADAQQKLKDFVTQERPDGSR